MIYTTKKYHFFSAQLLSNSNKSPIFALAKPPKHGTLAEWLGNGLQNRVQQFESARYLHQKQLKNLSAVFSFCLKKHAETHQLSESNNEDGFEKNTLPITQR